MMVVAVQKRGRAELYRLTREVRASWTPAQRRQRTLKGQRRSQGFVRWIGLSDAGS